MPKLKELKPSSPPDDLHPTWRKHELQDGEDVRDIDGQYDCDMPTPEQYKEHERALAWWRAKQVGGRPMNYMRQKYRNKALQYSPLACQFSHQIDDGHSSLFGDAIRCGLNGGASKSGNLHVTARLLFDFISQYMAKQR
jgi:hypothetical protein